MTRITFHELKLSAMNGISGLRNRRLALVPALVLCCVVFVVRAHSELSPESRHTNTLAARWPALPTAAQSPRIKAIYFRITPLGIEPAELTLPAGRYLVAIDNDSGFNVVDVKIDKERGPRLGNAQLPSGRRKWREFVVFTPGVFVFTDPGNANRVCSLTITNQ